MRSTASLVTVDYPDAVTDGLRRHTDVLRSVLERTRGDLTLAIRQDQMRAALLGLELNLDRQLGTQLASAGADQPSVGGRGCGRRAMRRDRTLVRASDVGLYAFCARAWWLARVQEADHDNPARLAHGTSVHSAHGAQVRRIGQARRAALRPHRRRRPLAHRLSRPHHLRPMTRGGIRSHQLSAAAAGAAADAGRQRHRCAAPGAAPGRRRRNAAVGEERSVYQPDTWLIQRCWEVLADAGAVQEALAVARLHAAAPAAGDPPVSAPPLPSDRPALGLWRQRWRSRCTRAVAPLLRPDARSDAAQMDPLLYGAATAANLAERTLAFACLERLDQCHQPWQRPIVQPDQRKLLAETVLRSGPHPLTAALIAFAVRRFDDAGAQLVGEISAGASEHLRHSSHAPKMARLLALSVAAMRNSTLTTLHARRVAATIFGQAGLVSEVLAQLTTVANIQLARRESGLPGRTPDQPVLRQVKRPNANSDIDFQVHTLCQAVRAMPQARLSSEERIELANQLAMLGGQSDGWTAAGAAATLLELGAVRFAVEMVEKIPAGDPTRVEGVIELVRGLLARGDAALAREQVQKGLTWARAYPGRNPERALIWGIAEIYLERDEPQHALAILDQRRGETGFSTGCAAASAANLPTTNSTTTGCVCAPGCCKTGSAPAS
jgi:hypothetical protein